MPSPIYDSSSSREMNRHSQPVRAFPSPKRVHTDDGPDGYSPLWRSSL